MRKSSEIIEDLIDSLEKMIDAQDDMWEEEKYSNYREMSKLRVERLIPAKDEFKKHLDEYVDRRIETYMQKYGIRKTIFSEEPSS
jgi:hypothetical protein